MKYAIVENGIVVDAVIASEPLADNWIATDDPRIGWLWDGQTFSEPPAPAPEVPASVTMRQARLALLGAGKLSSVDAAIDALPEPAKSAARIEWEYAATVERNSPLIAQMAPALGLSGAEMDALFIQASSL